MGPQPIALASGYIRAGLVTHAGPVALHDKAGTAAFLGVQAGDHLTYVAEAGSDPVAGFDARSNIRRALLATAGGKALLAARSDAEREAYLRRRRAEERELVDKLLDEYAEIRRTRIAIATTLNSQSGEAAAITLVGSTADMQPRAKKLADLLLRRVESWSQRSMTPREAI